MRITETWSMARGIWEGEFRVWNSESAGSAVRTALRHLFCALHSAYGSLPVIPPPSQEATASRLWRNAGVPRSLGEGGLELRRVPPYRRCHGLHLGFAVCSLWLLTSCTTSRPDLVWTEDGCQYGKASWYDDHGERTASGEIYNKHAMTAAHSSLALNTVVEVTNLRNGRKVTVRINDRLPPIHEGRVIDLSTAAFRKLDSMKRGLLGVKIRVIKYGNNKYVKVNRSAPSGRMHLSNPGRMTNSQKPSASKGTL